MLKKCLLWGTGEIFREYINLIRFHEMKKHFKVIGITSNTRIYAQYEEYVHIPKENIMTVQFDMVVVMGKGEIFREIYHEAVNMGISKEKILPYKMLTYSTFDIDRYCILRKNPPTIFSNNCWGGLTYHSLGLPFCSPLINAFESELDYLSLLRDPERYFAEPLKMDGVGENNYPICLCGDIRIHFNHACDFESANKDWEKRKQRINWDNLLVEMFTENKDVAEEFVKLPYQKKICFVPFESDDPALVFVEFRNTDGMKEIPFWKIVNGMATGAYPYYDPFVLAEAGKIKKICCFR